MSAAQIIPDRLRLRAVLVERRGMSWATGTGSLAHGHIDRDLQMHWTQAEAEAAAIAMADALDMLVARA